MTQSVVLQDAFAVYGLYTPFRIYGRPVEPGAYFTLLSAHSFDPQKLQKLRAMPAAERVALLDDDIDDDILTKFYAQSAIPLGIDMFGAHFYGESMNGGNSWMAHDHVDSYEEPNTGYRSQCKCLSHS